METLLKTQEGPSSQPQANTFAITSSNDLTNIPDLPAFPEGIDEPPSPPGSGSNNPHNGQIFLPQVVNRTGAYGWDMISLGLEEPLPTREVVDELYVLTEYSPYTPSMASNSHIGTKSTSKKSTLPNRFYTGHDIWHP